MACRQVVAMSSKAMASADSGYDGASPGAASVTDDRDSGGEHSSPYVHSDKLSLDETIARDGHSLKLFPHTCPDLWSQVQALARIYQAVEKALEPYDDKSPGPVRSLSLAMARAAVRTIVAQHMFPSHRGRSQHWWWYRR